MPVTVPVSNQSSLQFSNPSGSLVTPSLVTTSLTDPRLLSPQQPALQRNSVSPGLPQRPASAGEQAAPHGSLGPPFPGVSPALTVGGRGPRCSTIWLFSFQGPCWGETSTVQTEPAPALLVSGASVQGRVVGVTTLDRTGSFACTHRLFLCGAGNPAGRFTLASRAPCGRSYLGSAVFIYISHRDEAILWGCCEPLLPCAAV